MPNDTDTPTSIPNDPLGNIDASLNKNVGFEEPLKTE
jgi:hypothetical protein